MRVSTLPDKKEKEGEKKQEKDAITQRSKLLHIITLSQESSMSCPAVRGRSCKVPASYISTRNRPLLEPLTTDTDLPHLVKLHRHTVRGDLAPSPLSLSLLRMMMILLMS